MKNIFLLILFGFMGACTHKTNIYNFENVNSVKLDESKVVLTRYPLQLEEINDSVVATINSYAHLSMYNIYSGKNIANFSINNINFDSLIHNTFEKKYEGKRKYTYDKGQETSGMGQRVGLFQYIHDDFYIYVSTLAEVNYQNDSLELLKLNEDKKINRVKKIYKNARIRSFEYVQFLFITDDKFNMKEVVPLYESPLLKNGSYSPYYEKAFYVDENDLHFFLFKMNEPYETLRSKKNLKSYYTAATDLKDQTETRFILNNNKIDYSGFSFDDYLGSSAEFYKNNGKLLFSNGKEICEVESGKKIFSRKKLKANEWIKSFYINEDDDKIIMVSYNEDRKQHPTEFEEHYAIDSINSTRIKVFDTKTSQWISEKNLISGFYWPILVTKNKIIGFDKDKQNYYFKYITYNEEN